MNMQQWFLCFCFCFFEIIQWFFATPGSITTWAEVPIPPTPSGEVIYKSKLSWSIILASSGVVGSDGSTSYYYPDIPHTMSNLDLNESGRHLQISFFHIKKISYQKIDYTKRKTKSQS